MRKQKNQTTLRFKANTFNEMMCGQYNKLKQIGLIVEPIDADEQAVDSSNDIKKDGEDETSSLGTDLSFDDHVLLDAIKKERSEDESASGDEEAPSRRALSRSSWRSDGSDNMMKRLGLSNDIESGTLGMLKQEIARNVSLAEKRV